MSSDAHAAANVAAAFKELPLLTPEEAHGEDGSAPTDDFEGGAPPAQGGLRQAGRAGAIFGMGLGVLLLAAACHWQQRGDLNSTGIAGVEGPAASAPVISKQEVTAGPALIDLPVQFWHSGISGSLEGTGGYSLYSRIYNFMGGEGHPLMGQTGLGSSWFFMNSAAFHPDTCACSPSHSFNCCGHGDKCFELAATFEGGPGYWRDTLPTTQAKWRVGASTGCHRQYARTLNWDPKDGSCDKMNMVQVSNNMFIPPDGASFDRKGLMGWAWVNTPLGKTHEHDDQRNFWTLVFDSDNFNGPVTYILPEFFEVKDYNWEKQSASLPNLGDFKNTPRDHLLEMGQINFEVQGFNMYQGTNGDFKLPRLSVPNVDGRAVIMTGIRSYKFEDVWQPLEDALTSKSFDAGKIMAQGTPNGITTKSSPYYVTLPGGKKLRIGTNKVKMDRGDVVWAIHMKGCPRNADSCPFPRYVAADGTVIPESQAPEDLRNSPPFPTKKNFEPDYTDDGPAKPDSEKFNALGTDYGACMQSPGPADSELHCVLTKSPTWVGYRWYKFIDQPALQRLGLSKKQKAYMQNRIEGLHKVTGRKGGWLKTPAVAKDEGLASFDAGIVVTPPKGLEHGYVPIVVYEGLQKPPGCPADVCGMRPSSNIGWTGAEDVQHGIDSWKKCCDICKVQSKGHKPHNCKAWVFYEDGGCYQKYDTGILVSFEAGSGIAGILQ